jgi:hypothetical protein
VVFQTILLSEITAAMVLAGRHIRQAAAAAQGRQAVRRLLLQAGRAETEKISAHLFQVQPITQAQAAAAAEALQAEVQATAGLQEKLAAQVTAA